MMPAAPLVGAVTTRPPAAFSSLTAIAYRVTHSMACARRVALGAQLAGGLRGAAPDLQTAGQDALAGHPALHAGLHHPPDVQQPGADLGLGAPRLLVLQHQRGDRQAGLPGEPQQFVAGAERVPQHRVVQLDPVLADRVLVDHEAAADRVVRLLQQRRARRVVREQPHAVGVVRQRAAPVQDQVGVRVEVDLVGAEHAEPLVLADTRRPRRRRSPRRPCAASGPTGRAGPPWGCRGRGRSRRASRTAPRVRRRCGRAGPRSSAGARRCRPPASGRRCASWRGRCRWRRGRRPRLPRALLLGCGDAVVPCMSPAGRLRDGALAPKGAPFAHRSAFRGARGPRPQGPSPESGALPRARGALAWGGAPSPGEGRLVFRGAGNCATSHDVAVRRHRPKGAVAVASGPPAGGRLPAQFLPQTPSGGTPSAPEKAPSSAEGPRAARGSPLPWRDP